MSKEIDNLLDNLIKEIDAQDGQPVKETKPASAEAQKRAEAIAKGVNQSYRRPPEPVKTSIPAPRIKPVVEPEPTSHFSDERSADPAIRMHDRLDESTLPAPDTERRPTQIMEMGKKGKKRRDPAASRSIPAPPEAPKRKIPHIQVPDELPPDVESAAPPAADPDPEREALVKSRAEKIREQLKKRTLEETPIIPPPSEEEINDMLNDLENPEQPEVAAPEEGGNIFAYLHQVLGVEEEQAEPEETPAPEEMSAPEQPAARPRWFDDAPAPAPIPLHRGNDDAEDYDEEYDDEYDDYDEDAYDEEESAAPSRLRHLEDEEELEEKRENPIIAFFKNLFGKRVSDDEEETGDEESFDDEDLYEDDALDYPEDEPELAEEDLLPDEEDDAPASAPLSVTEEELEEPEALPEETPAEEAPAEEALPAEEESTPEEDFDDEYEDELSDEELLSDSEDEETPEVDEEEIPETPVKQRSFFREAFDESAEELADIKAEPVPEPDAEAKPRFLSRNSYFAAGVVVFILAVIGLITVISGIAKAAGGFFGGGSVKKQLEKALYPVAVVDVPTFNEPGELTAEGALSAAIVDILMNDDLSGYTETFDMIAVPAEDVLARGRQMFGVDVQTQLDTLHAAGESFVYDEQTGCYNVPVNPMIFSYSPEVTSVKRTGDTYEVTVVYHSDVADWQENSRNFTEGSSKTMRATVEKKNTGYRIVSLAAVAD